MIAFCHGITSLCFTFHPGEWPEPNRHESTESGGSISRQTLDLAQAVDLGTEHAWCVFFYQELRHCLTCVVKECSM